MTSNTLQISLVEKWYKTLYGFLSPLFGMVAVICAILCVFESEEGSNSRMICAILLVISALMVAGLKMLNRYLDKKSVSYHVYQSKLVNKLDPGNMIPLLAMFLIVIFPFYILLVTSLKSPLEANTLGFTWWPQQGIDLESYREIFVFGEALSISLIQSIWNSFVYAIVPSLIGLFAAALSAYAFSKLEFKGKDTMYQMLIMTMMMPGCVTMTTSYLMYDVYGWTNSALPLIIPGCFSGATTVMFLREFFMGIPDGLLEAARIDGSGKWQSFFSIVLPLGKPALMAQFVLGFITRYNDFLNPLIYLNDTKDYTIQIALSFLDGFVQDKALIASVGVFSLVPMLLLYVIFQKPILNGISMSSGLKG